MDRLRDDRRGRRRRAEAGGPVGVELDGVDYEVLLVESDPDAYDAFYNVIANPILWFIQHYLWDLSNAPDIRREEMDAWATATRSSTTTSPTPSAQIEATRGPAGDAPRLPPLHVPGR